MVSRKTRKRYTTPWHPQTRASDWIVISIRGDAYSRGKMHGKRLKPQIQDGLKVMEYTCIHQFKTTVNEYITRCVNNVSMVMKADFPEFYKEMQGIADGAGVSVDAILAWNCLLSMAPVYKVVLETSSQRCSAFIATGDATSNGKIVMAHNTHCDYVLGSVSNVVIYVYPDEGHAFCMQTCPGYICSSMDWFLCSTGMIGCETTISHIRDPPEFGAPYFCRIRKCMQYGETLDDYVSMMLENSAGDYSCSWLFGDIRTNEIMLCELGRHHHHVERTNNGVYFGMNAAISQEIRVRDTTDRTLKGTTATSSGSRNERLQYLVLDKYYGKLNCRNSQKIIADHYDPMLHREHLSSRTICKHSWSDETSPIPYFITGAVDGKVVNSDLAKHMMFYGRFGSSCGMPFSAKEFIANHPEYEYLRPWLRDFPKYDWQKIGNGGGDGKKLISKTYKHKTV